MADTDNKVDKRPVIAFVGFVQAVQIEVVEQACRQMHRQHRLEGSRAVRGST